MRDGMPRTHSADSGHRADHDAAVAVASEILGPLAERDAPIGALTTYRVGGAADILVRMSTPNDIETLCIARRESGLPLLIMGRGSNLLIADEGFRGIAVSATAMTDLIDMQDEARVVAGSGVLLPVLARRTAAASLTGLEWAVGVPGSVGGAVRMNAGGHGSDIAASLVSVRMVDFAADAETHDALADAAITGADPATANQSGSVRSVSADDLGLRFRGSDISGTSLLIDATFQLAHGDRLEAERQISEIVQWRRANQPGGQNAGSVFVNPVPGVVACGALIDEAGLRGMRHGTATVSEKHANFIQADEDGSADDVRELMRLVRDRVELESGFRLRSEIRLIGFPDDL